MRVIGLTGGIASGKSTVSALLQNLGVKVIDADQVSRSLTEPGQPALVEIAHRFPGVVQEDGTLNRALLGDRVFGQEQERLALNAILHPRVQAQVSERLRALEAAGERWVIYEVPLLFENRLQDKLDGVILVSAPEEVQITRLATRNGLTRAQAQARIASQMPLSEKKKMATWVVENAGDLASLQAQVEALWREIQP